MELHRRAHRELLRQQLDWAERRELEVDASGHVRGEGNLLAPPSPETRAELLRARTRPLGEAGKPAPIAHLLSRTALVVNVFDAWRGEDLAPLCEALGAPSDASRIAFGVSIDEAGLAPADALFDGGPRPTYLLASFAAPYEGAPPRPEGANLDAPSWKALPGCRALAGDLAANPHRFSQLDVGRVLAAGVAAAARHGARGARLVLLWWRAPGPSGDALAREVDRLRMRVGGDLDLETRSAGEVLPALCAARGDGGYARALAERYGPR